MSRKLVLYPKFKVCSQDFTGCEIVTVPNQAMSLEEILKRFTRKEQLPIEQKGVYVEGLGDLEKQQYDDIVIRRERAAEYEALANKAKAKLDDEERIKSQKATEEQFEKWAKEKGLERPSVAAPPVSGA